MSNIKVKIRKHAKGFGYFGGEITDLPSDKAAYLINKGYAMLIPEEKEENDTLFPDGFPAAKELFNLGYESIEAVDEDRKAGILKTKGLTKGQLMAIGKYFAKLNKA